MSRAEVVGGTVRDLAETGEGVVATERGLVFVRGVLPDEQVRVRLLPKKGRVQRGQLVRIDAPSDARIEPVCKHAARCGGCPLMHAELSVQRRIKLKFLRSALDRAGVPADLAIDTLDAEHTLAYRRRARLSFHAHGKLAELGFKREHSGQVIDIDACAVLVEPLALALTEIRTALADKLAGEGEISFALGKEGKAVCVIHTNTPQSPATYGACAALIEKGALAGLALYAAGVSAPATFGDPTEWSTGSDGLPMRGTLAGFSQAHGVMNDALVRQVTAWAETKDARVLELYAGHGNLSTELAAGALAYTAVEQDNAALEAARENLKLRSLPAKLVCADALQWTGKGPFDVIVLDPPRVGAAGLLAKLVAAKPKRIVYVSCDPATLGRDLREALSRGYRVDRIACIEMFPQTADLETVARLVPV